MNINQLRSHDTLTPSRPRLTPKERSRVIQERVDKHMRVGGMSYDDAWRTANADPDMQPIVRAMKQPAPPQPEIEDMRSGNSIVATPQKFDHSAALQRRDQFQALVKKRMQEYNESYPDAFAKVLQDPANAAIVKAMKTPDSQKPADLESVIATIGATPFGGSLR
jgi:hypothetical protein